jgi:glycosyltransferase involved in cell wall biosynthesis
MTTPSLTIAIPFHTGKEFLQRAIASVIAQSDPDWELVVCDDGPETDVAALVSSYTDARIRYVRADGPSGMVANWNRCLDHAQSSWVTLLHADDELLPNYVGVMRKAAALAPQAAGFFCQTKIIDGKGKGCFSFPDWIKGWLRPGGKHLVIRGQPGLASLLRGNYIMCPTMCYNLERLGNQRFAEGWRFAQDLELFARLLTAGECLVGVPDTAYAYRRHDANATVQYTANLQRFREEAALYEQLHSQALACNWPQVARVARRKLIIKANLLFCLLTDVAKGQMAQAGQKWRFLQGLSRTP